MIITDRGRPAHVLLSIDRYRALLVSTLSIVELISMPDAERIKFAPRKLRKVARDPELA